MLVTQTIRRKMLCWLAILVVLLAGLFYSSISGLTSYRRTVKDLELSIREAPRSADLATAISVLIRPCTMRAPAAEGERRSEAARLQQAEFERALAESQRRFQEFRERLQKLRTSGPGFNESDYRPLFEGIQQHFANLRGEVACLTQADRERHLEYIISIIGDLVDTIDAIPDPALQLSDRLEKAQAEYRWRLTMVWATSIMAGLLLTGLVLVGWRWIFRPLKRLHQGAMRVASGDDFDFRLEATSGCELAELAEAFNSMTARFQQVRADLDEQVQQRSRQLIQSERLAGVGFLSAGVAHEINNPLSAIVGAADSLEWRLGEHLDKLPPDDAQVIREYLQMMQSEAQRCRKITERLLDFARGSNAERNLYDVTAIVQEVVSMTHHLGRFRDREVTVDRKTPCYAWVNGPEIKQVVLNLVANALESTASGGHVSIRIRECPQHVEVSVVDDGVGMTPDVLEHIFEPFFTQRKTGQGTGLGLSISHRIVQDHGGSLEASSAGPGQGSTFRLRVPKQAPATRAA